MLKLILFSLFLSGCFSSNKGTTSFEDNSPAATNTAPVLASIGDKSILENNTLTITLSATDADGDSISYAKDGTVGSGDPFTVTNAADFNTSTGVFTWTPQTAEVGSYDVRFTVSDGQGGQDSETITITVTSNTAPTLAAIENKTVTVGDTLNFTISATDPNNDTITFSTDGTVGNDGNPYNATTTNATFTVGTGVFNWVPSTNDTGTYQVKFTADDGNASSDSETITITVSLNQAPVLSSIGDRTFYTHKTTTIVASATDNESDTITYSVDGAVGPNLNPLTAPTGTKAVFTVATRSLAWKPDFGDRGNNYSIKFLATDAGGSNTSDTETIKISVRAATYSFVNTNIIATKCAPCHTSRSDGGVSLSSYTGLNANKTAALSAVNAGTMPQGAPNLSSEEIQAIQDWVDDGAQNN